MDEYTSELFLGGENTLVIHNTCEDSLLAAPLMMVKDNAWDRPIGIQDLVLLAELCERVEMKSDDDMKFKKVNLIFS